MSGHSFSIFIEQDFQGEGSLSLSSEHGRRVSNLKLEEQASACSSHLPVYIGGGEGRERNVPLLAHPTVTFSWLLYLCLRMFQALIPVFVGARVQAPVPTLWPRLGSGWGAEKVSFQTDPEACRS